MEPDVSANLKRLLDEAPPTNCGVCRVPMEAHAVNVTVSVNFDWHLTNLSATDALSAYVFPDPWCYTGNIEYRCPKCGVSLFHQQAVTLHSDGFHFQPPQEAH